MKKYFRNNFTTPGISFKHLLICLRTNMGQLTKTFSIAACMVIIGLPLLAQQITVQGKVINSQTQAAVPGTTVTILGKPGGVTADNNGLFTINGSVGDQLNVQSVGYAPVLLILLVVILHLIFADKILSGPATRH